MATRIQWVKRAQRAARVFRLPYSIYTSITQSPDPDSAVAAWKRWGKELQSAWKRAAADAHPDRGGEHESFIELQEAWEFIQDEKFAVALWLSEHLEYLRPAPLTATSQRYQVFTGMSIHSTTGAASTTTSTGSIFADGVIIFRYRG